MENRPSEDSSNDSVLEVFHIEVDEQTNALAAQLQMCQEQRLVNGQKFLNSLDLDNDRFLHEKVDAISTVDFDAVIDNGQLGSDPVLSSGPPF